MLSLRRPIRRDRIGAHLLYVETFSAPSIWRNLFTCAIKFPRRCGIPENRTISDQPLRLCIIDNPSPTFLSRVVWSFVVCQALTPRYVYDGVATHRFAPPPVDHARGRSRTVTGRLAAIDIPETGPPGPLRRPI